MDATKQRLFTDTGCDVRFDDLTRQLYATDASIYQIVPAGVALPKSAAEASAVVQAAAEAGVPVIPRGAGTGLAGGALGEGVVIDFSRYNTVIGPFDPERKTVRVGAGVVLDQLNKALRPHGLWFGPDVATSSRATLGGMIANNSSGAHVPVYGTTGDHVDAIEAVLADGRVVHLTQGHTPDAPDLADLHAAVDAIAAQCRGEIESRIHPGILKRWAVYGLDNWVRKSPNLIHTLAGSEGTLAAIASAELRLCPLPSEKGVGLFFFPSVAEAMQASVELLDLEPAAIEHIDRVLFDQTRGQLAFAAARSLLRLDEEPCEAILIVEFFEHVHDKLAALESRTLGQRKLIVTDPDDMARIWNLRKAGLSLLTGCPGPAKPIPGIEDAAVAPRDLPEYVAGLQKAMDGLGLSGSFYGHAASGLLHVRPVIDLHQASDIAKYRKLALEVAALVRQFKGSIAAEHGVGMARTEFLAAQVGPELMDAMRRIKALFDPAGRFNPGKILDGSPYRIDTHLRWGDGYAMKLPFKPVVEFARKHESILGNIEQCNGVGGCRKLEPTMCPTYLVTGEEIMATRGRANVLRATFDGRLPSQGKSFYTPELDVALSNCVSCKACTSECPSNVNMALLKAQVLHARHQAEGLSIRDRIVSSVDRLGALGTLAPGLANRSLQWRWLRRLLERVVGIAQDRPMPPYAAERFDRWFARHRPEGPAPRGTVILWDDTFVRYNEPHIGQAAVRVLEAAGFRVVLAQGRQCCGRPAYSTGCLDRAAALGRHNVALLAKLHPDAPIVFLEPSCYSMFAEDYLDLGIGGAEAVKQRSVLFEYFLDDLLESDPDALTFQPGYTWVAIHAHCHAKALTQTQRMKRLAERLPNSTVTLLDTACCGMAGQFGMLANKQDLSLKMGERVADLINAQRAGTHIVASGASCRHQIDHLTPAAPLHMAEVFAQALER